MVIAMRAVLVAFFKHSSVFAETLLALLARECLFLVLASAGRHVRTGCCLAGKERGAGGMDVPCRSTSEVGVALAQGGIRRSQTICGLRGSS